MDTVFLWAMGSHIPWGFSQSIAYLALRHNNIEYLLLGSLLDV